MPITTVLFYLLVAYVTVAVCKFVLVMPSIPIAVAAASWNETKIKGKIVTRHVVTIPMYWLLVCLFWWAPTLWHERSRFFFAYRDRDVIRDAMWAYRFVEQQKAAQRSTRQK